MMLVHTEEWVHAGTPAMPRSGSATRIRRILIIAAIWAVVSGFSALSLYLRTASGELKLGPRWLWVTLSLIPIWTMAQIPVLSLSRRFPFERRAWGVAS